MSEQKKKTAAQEMRELHDEIKKSLKPSKELINALIRSRKMKQKDETDKEVARPYTPEAGA
jgi:hypothetical protein